MKILCLYILNKVSTHSRPKAAGCFRGFIPIRLSVSTHSRPKAAGVMTSCTQCVLNRFNTQPPEGGWMNLKRLNYSMMLFQHTAARRRLELENTCRCHRTLGFNTQPPEGGWFEFGFCGKSVAVSTHSRPKAAGTNNRGNPTINTSFNTQPPEGGWDTIIKILRQNGSFNTQPPEGGW